MPDLAETLWTFLTAAAHLVTLAGQQARPWLPLALWAAFWLFAVDWLRLRRILVPQGGLIALALIGLFVAWVSTLVWPTPAGSTLLPVVQRIAVLTTWVTVMMACGAIQLLGWTAVWIPRLPEAPGNPGTHVRVFDFESEAPRS